jgi:hypothetical protein
MSPGDNPLFTITFPSTAGLYYIWADVTMEYDADAVVWTIESSEIGYATSLPSLPAENVYCQIGRVTVTENDGVFSSSITAQDVSGNQEVMRNGNATVFTDRCLLR